MGQQWALDILDEQAEKEGAQHRGEDVFGGARPRQPGPDVPVPMET
jgi:hypothetical protein